jgi:hypothetical protein
MRMMFVVPLNYPCRIPLRASPAYVSQAMCYVWRVVTANIPVNRIARSMGNTEKYAGKRSTAACQLLQWFYTLIPFFFLYNHVLFDLVFALLYHSCYSASLFLNSVVLNALEIRFLIL